MKLLTWNEYVRLALSYAEFVENEDGTWSVEVPVLPGCATWGETRAEAASMAEDAVHGGSLLPSGLETTFPRSTATHSATWRT